MKKIILSAFSAILAVIMLVTGTSTAFAVEGIQSEVSQPEIAEGEIFHFFDYSLYKSYAVAMVCLDGKYTQKGEMPTVFLDIYRNPNTKTELLRSVQVQPNLIEHELYVHEGVYYPQVFLTIPADYFGQRSQTVIRIAEGAYLTSDGTASKEVQILYNACNNVDNFPNHFTFTCTGEKVTKTDSKPIQILKKSKVSASGDFTSKYADVWKANAKVNFYFMSEQLLESDGDQISADREGNYRVEYKLNDLVKIEKNFIAVNAVTRYFENLGQLIVALLLAPIALVVGLVMFIFIPGFGTWIGGTSIYASIAAIPSFFMALFGVGLSREYTF